MISLPDHPLRRSPGQSGVLPELPPQWGVELSHQDSINLQHRSRCMANTSSPSPPMARAKKNSSQFAAWFLVSTPSWLGDLTMCRINVIITNIAFYKDDSLYILMVVHCYTPSLTWPASIDWCDQMSVSGIDQDQDFEDRILTPRHKSGELQACWCWLCAMFDWWICAVVFVVAKYVDFKLRAGNKVCISLLYIFI